MSFDFGVVKKYFPDRGFGFVTRTFVSGRQSEVFFHIRKIKKTNPELAESMSDEDVVKNIYFWYETEESSKGEQVCIVLENGTNLINAIDNIEFYIVKIENIWKNIDIVVPAWLHVVTVDLVGDERAKELKEERLNLEKKRQEVEEKNRMEQEAQRVKRNNQKELEEKEFEQLVAEIEPLGFSYSASVSKYIMDNKLGYKYKNISGIVIMEKDGDTWNFNGGFPSKIYARLCKELGVRGQRTRSRVVGFEPFNNLRSRRSRE